MEALETFTINGNTVEILPDDDAGHSNPREACPLGTFWTQESRYRSPDALPSGKNVFDAIAQEFGARAYQESMEKALDRECIWLRVYRYEHSGVAYRAAMENPFHCPWDSGQVGYVFVKKSDVRKEYGVKRISPAIRATALSVLRSEVEVYSEWANGEVFGFRVLDSEGEELDSCWGFIGMDHVQSEAISAAEYCAPVMHPA